jgi:hypothetical protein
LKQQKIPQEKYENFGTSITSAFAIAFTLSCHMKFLYDIAFDFCLNLLAVAAGHSGWHNSDIQRDCAKMVSIQDLLAPNAVSTFSADDSLVLGKQVTVRFHFDYVCPVACLLLTQCVLFVLRYSVSRMWTSVTDRVFGDTQVLMAVQTLRRMHPDARDILMSEILCDAMYTIYYGGFRFTYSKQMSTVEIHPQTSKISDILHEIKHRLGYLPENAKNEEGQRYLINLLISNNLAFHRQKSNDIVYNLRSIVCFADIESESMLSRKIRIFKNTSRAHYSNTRRLVSQQHAAYKRVVTVFFADIAKPVAETCATWLCRESALMSVESDAIHAQLHRTVATFERQSRQ